VSFPNYTGVLKLAVAAERDTVDYNYLNGKNSHGHHRHRTQEGKNDGRPTQRKQQIPQLGTNDPARRDAYS